MIRTRTTTALAIAAALGTGTALAQSTGPGTTPGGSTTTPGTSTITPNTLAPGTGPAGTSPTLGAATPGGRTETPSQRNPVLTDRENVRASKVIGSTVYNDKDEKIGTIDEILLDKEHKATAAVLSVGGFLGLGAKLVEVPYEQLQFGDTRETSENRVKMPGATKESLQGMADFRYRDSGG